MIKFIGQKDNAENVSVFWNRIKQIFAPLHSPEFTGTPHAPTPASGDNTTRIATTAFVADAVPKKTSDLTNDSGFISTETDPTVPSWAKQSTKPTYTASEVGALPASTPIPSKTSDLTNDSGFITTETDPTVPSWAKASSKPSYTASEVGALPISGGTLTGALTLSGAPTANLHPATKKYVDDLVGDVESLLSGI